MMLSSFWSRLLTVLLVSAVMLTFAVKPQGSTIVQAGVLEQVPAATEATTHVLSYQGRLADPATGAPKADGDYSMTFRIYNVASGGTALWTEIKDVTVSKGLFSTLLGDTTALPSTIFDGNDRWLGVKVGSDAETTPRMRLAFAPYASYALNAGTLSGQNSAFYRNATNLNAGTVADARLDASITRDSEVMTIVKAGDGSGSTLDADLLDGQDSAFYRNATNLNAGAVADARIPAEITRDNEVLGIVKAGDGAGSTLDADLLDGRNSSDFVGISGGTISSNNANPVLKVTQSGTSPNQGVAGLFSSTESYGVQGETNSGAVGIAGVRGTAGLPGVTIAGKSGVLGQSDTGKGVVGASEGDNGVYGWSTNTWAVRGDGKSGGIFGLSWGEGSDAIRGVNNATAGASWGVVGVSASPDGRGVAGFNNATTGLAEGLYGSSNSVSGRGVHGSASATTGANYGVYGESSSTSGRGVYGQSPYLGVYGYSSGTSGSYGVYGYASAANSNNYAGYFAGNARVTGNLSISGSLSKGSGTFKIDHPLDPENKYLSHSFVESPDMLNVYNGNVTLGEDGSAWVDLPTYFQALNRDFRYQLTPIGGPGPNLYIAQEVQNNRFQIAGGGPGLRVSWQVTGIRQDPYANAHRVVVEEEKPAEEKGTYLHPDVYGVDRSRGLDAKINPEFSTGPAQQPSARPSGDKDDPALFQPLGSSE